MGPLFCLISLCIFADEAHSLPAKSTFVAAVREMQLQESNDVGPNESGALYCCRKPSSGLRWVDYEEESDSWFDLLFGDLFKAAMIAALKGTLFVTFNAATAFTDVSFSDEVELPVWEAQVDSVWYFENRSHRVLTLGDPVLNSRSFDLGGSPGLYARLVHQTFHRLATECVFDFYSDSHQIDSLNSSEIMTIPSISFPSSAVSARRVSGLYSGQVNFLLRNNPFVYTFAGFRWWHDQDKMSLSAPDQGIGWETTAQTNAPLLQIGVQFGKPGKLSLRNRFCLGAGPAIGRAETELSGVIGAVNRIESRASSFAVLGEMRSEVVYSVNHWLTLQAGTQLSSFSTTLRPSKLIEVTDTVNGTMRHRTNAVLFSGLFFGLTLAH